MKRAIYSLVALLALAGFVVAQEAGTTVPEEGTEGKILAGYHDVDLEGLPTRAAEFESLDSDWHLRAEVASAFLNSGLVSYHGDVWDSDEQSHALRLEAGRAMRLAIDYDRFEHHLDHDPMSNLDAVAEIKIVTKTDFNPDEANHIRYSNAHAGVTGKAPGLPGFYYGVDFREQKREGTRQEMTTGHCFACHVFSRNRQVDERTQDISGTLGYQGKRWSIQYRFTDRQYDEDGATPTVVYDDAYRPNDPNLQVFEDRVMYQESDGALAYGQVPDSEKQSHVLKANVQDGRGGVFSGAVVSSSVENNVTGLNTDYESVRLRYHTPFRKGKTTLTLGYRYEDIDNDDVYVDLVENPAVAGPTVGLTYPEVWGDGGLYDRGFVGDFTRRSALTRDVWAADAAVRFRLPRRNSLRFEYNHREIDRDNYHVTEDGETTTREDRVRAVLNGRPSKEWRYRLDASRMWIDDPFVNVNGGCQAPAEEVYGTTGSSPKPLLPESLQYYELHELRRADLTNVPTDVFAFKASTTFTPNAKTSWTFMGRYNTKENGHTQATDWEQDSWMAGTSFWFAPSPNWFITGYYSHMEEESTTQYCMPLYDGWAGGTTRGQFGSAYDAVDWDLDSDIVSLRLDIPFTDRAAFFADYTWMQTTGSMDMVYFEPLDPAVGAILANHDMDFSSIHEYSDIDVERDDLTVGFNFNTTHGFLFQVAYMWVDYEDNDPILTDEDGEYDVLWASVGWQF